MRRFLPFVLAAMVAFSARAAGNVPEERKLPKSGGSYTLVLPARYKDLKLCDVLVALHGAGDTAANYARVWQQWMGERETILAVPEAGTAAGPGFTWSTGDLARVIETVEDVTANFRVDKRRIYLNGHSAGCAVGFHFLSKNPEIFAGFGGTAHGIQQGLVNEKELVAAAAKTVIYYAVGKKDPNHAIFQDTVDRLTKMKFIFKAEDPDIGHTVTAEEAKAMFAFFDSVTDKAGQEKLTRAKKYIEEKKWKEAEKLLDETGTGVGLAARQAREILEALRKDWEEKLTAAKVFPGPEAVRALNELAREYPGASIEASARAAANAMAADPAVAALVAEDEKKAREKEAEGALAKAVALEAEKRLVPALREYERVVKTYAGTTSADKAKAAAERLAALPEVKSEVQEVEAKKLYSMAENYLVNNARDRARGMFEEISKKYPDCQSGKKAAKRLAEMP
ncbi:MAG: PHB depolymerase family esterase [Planctomycetota bacterium]